MIMPPEQDQITQARSSQEIFIQSVLPQHQYLDESKLTDFAQSHADRAVQHPRRIGKALL